MGGQINVFGWKGVNVTKDPDQLDDNELTKAQNCQPCPIADGSIEMRGGMAKLNASPAAGSIIGFTGVPLVNKKSAAAVRRLAITASYIVDWSISSNDLTAVTNTSGSLTPFGLMGTDDIRDDVKITTDYSTAATGRIVFQGNPWCVYQGRTFVAGDNYTYGVTAPTIKLYDPTQLAPNAADIAQYDVFKTVATIPYNIDVSATHIARAILSMITAGNGLIYLTVYDTGTPAGTNIKGRVFSLDPITFDLKQIGPTFPTIYQPYCLAWHQGRLWCGTNTNVSTDVGRVYWIRPGIDATWTLDHTTTAGQGNIISLRSYKGNLYAGTMADAGTAALVKKRIYDGTWSTSLTGPNTHIYNHYGSLVEFGGNLYAAYYDVNAVGPSQFARISKFDNAAWSTQVSYTDAQGSIPFHSTLLFNDKLFFWSNRAIGDASGNYTILSGSIGLRTTDGTTFTTLNVGTNGVPASLVILPIIV